MKRMIRRGRIEDQGVDLTPMLDVVFIMLIFFIVTASFTKETAIEVDRPNGIPTETLESEAIVLRISESNQIWLGDRIVDIRRVQHNIMTLLAEVPDAPVVVRVDADATNGVFIRVIDQARQAGASRVALVEEI